jgi:hypothetical protein
VAHGLSFRGLAYFTLVLECMGIAFPPHIFPQLPYTCTLCKTGNNVDGTEIAEGRFVTANACEVYSFTKKCCLSSYKSIHYYFNYNYGQPNLRPW